jgi:hypothetical protein
VILVIFMSCSSWRAAFSAALETASCGGEEQPVEPEALKVPDSHRTIIAPYAAADC